MGKSKKKEKYVPLTGLTGIGEDYNIYIMDPREKIIGYLIGFVAGFLAAQIMFGVVIASIVIGAAVGFYAIPVYRRYLQERRRKAILLQFRDMLDSLSNSFSAGKNTPDAFTDAYSDLKLAYGEQAPIVKEMAIIVSGLHNNFVIEDLLRDMSARCGIDDINSFAETFAVCNRLGGNLKKVVVDSRDIISDKIEIEMEIQTTVAANKNEINIMCVMEYSIKIDITKPIINIEYDKNAADSGTFFRESRRATITVKERNFDDSLVNITLRATNDGADIALPTVSGWTSSGDRHTTYPLENLTVSLSAGDNLLLQSVVVYLDDYSKAYKTWTAEEVAAIVADQGEFTFDIPGDSTGAHQVKIVCTDAAGNEQTEEITNFYVTTNLFVRYYNNKPLFFGSIAAVVVIAGVVIALAAGKKKKNDKEK